MEKKPRILIVDDTPANVKILNEILRADYYISVATQGENALKIADSDDRPDLILLDIMMPGMNGFDIIVKLKENEATKDIPVIFLTAKSNTEDEIRGFRSGAVDYITKPIRPEVVLARVKTHLSLIFAYRKLALQNKELIESAHLREDVERLVRHDLKTPLNGIIGVPNILMVDQNLSKEALKGLKLIEDAGLRMLSMINLSLDLFKMERGIYEFNPLPVDVLKIIQKIIFENRKQIQKKEISLDIILNNTLIRDENVFFVLGEKLLCYSLLANLIKNAIEASPTRQKIKIEITENTYAIIMINNQGVVPEEIRAKFFNKYVTFGKSAGTGLGTYSAKLIVETQKGSITMNSSKEEGTTILVHLLKSADNQELIKNRISQPLNIDDFQNQMSENNGLLRQSGQENELNLEKITPIFINLFEFLSKSDPVNIKLQVDVLSRYINRGKLSQFIEQIEEYDYDEALIILKKIAREIGIPGAQY